MIRRTGVAVSTVGLSLMVLCAAQAAEPSFGDLLARAHAQADAGHQWAPAGDNVTETLMAMMSLLPQATPEQLADFDALLHREQQEIAPPTPPAPPAPEAPAAKTARADSRTTGDTAGPKQPDAAPQASEQASGRAAATATPDARVATIEPPPTETPAAPKPAAPAPAAAMAPVTPTITPTGAPTGAAEPAPRRAGDAAGLAPAPVAAPPAKAAPDSPGPPPRQTATIESPPAAAPEAPPHASATGAGSAPQPAARPVAAPTPKPAAMPPALMADLYALGQAAEAQGNISGARRYYATAAEAGHAGAARALGRLYDPAYLQRKTIGGIDPDPEAARRWYERAAALEDPKAASALSAR